VLLVLEKYLFRFKEKSTPVLQFLKHVYLLVCTLFGWYLFRFEDLGQLGAALGSLFCLNGNPVSDGTTTLMLTNYCFFLVAAVLACTPLIKRIGKRMEWRAEMADTFSVKVYGLLTAVLPAVLIFLSFISLIGDSYNPFLYSQF